MTLVLIRTIVPRLRGGGTHWEEEPTDYEYTNGVLSVLAPDSRVGTFESAEEAIAFLKRAMHATIIEVLTEG